MTWAIYKDPVHLTAASKCSPHGTIRSPFAVSYGLIAMKIRDVIKMIEADGWYLLGQEGSHRQYEHLIKPGKVTIAGHPANPKTLRSVLRQAGLQK